MKCLVWVVQESLIITEHSNAPKIPNPVPVKSPGHWVVVVLIVLLVLKVRFCQVGCGGGAGGGDLN